MFAPEAVARAFLANLLAHPLSVASLLPLLNSQLLRPRGAPVPGAEDATSLFAEGLGLYPGALCDIQLIGQNNAVPRMTDKKSRPFGILRLIFATPTGELGVSIDDLFLTDPSFWRVGTDYGPLLTALATMCARHELFWDVCDDAGMAGHWRVANFKFLALAEEIYSPVVFIGTNLYLLVEEFRNKFPDDDVRFIHALPDLCAQLAPRLQPQAMKWVFTTPAAEKTSLARLHQLVLACTLPGEVAAFMDALDAFVLEEVVARTRSRYVPTAEGLPLQGRPALAENLYHAIANTK
jgi:hypothetical protein